MLASDSNACHRCPGHGSLRIDGPITLKLCQRCWLEWQTSALRSAFQSRVRDWLARGHDEAAPVQVREEET